MLFQSRHLNGTQNRHAELMRCTQRGGTSSRHRIADCATLYPVNISYCITAKLLAYERCRLLTLGQSHTLLINPT